MANELKIEIPHEELSALMGQSILDALSQDTREKLIQSALSHLITAPRMDRYSTANPKSPLQEAFDRAIYQLTNDLVREMVKADPIAQRVRDHVAEMIKPLDDGMQHNYELQTAVANAIISFAQEKLNQAS